MEPGKRKVISLAAGCGHVIYLDQQVKGRYLRKACLLISQKENKESFSKQNLRLSPAALQYEKFV